MHSIAEDFYKPVSELSGGQYFTLENFSLIHDTMMGIIYQEAANRRLDSLVTSGQLQQQSSSYVFLTKTMDEMVFGTEDLLKIHNAIHDANAESVEIFGQSHRVAVGNAGCKFVRVHGITFVEQNKKKSSQYARMALKGKKITWIVKCGEW